MDVNWSGATIRRTPGNAKKIANPQQATKRSRGRLDGGDGGKQGEEIDLDKR
jgi:hypothetical protein